MMTSILPLIFLAAHAATSAHVTLEHHSNSWELKVDGKPFLIKGGGGDASKELLVACGGNSFRTWGADNIDDKLDAAQKLGLKVTVGIWLGHTEHGFHYDNPASVAEQLAMVKKVVQKYKNHPAVLMWALGNEMEGYGSGENPLIWNAVEDAARATKQLDPNHPTMTVIAEIGGRKVPSVEKYCPDIDILGINSYGGGASLADRYRKAGGTKPYVHTEFGPPGVWESAKNSWGVTPEPTSTAKAAMYANVYQKTVVEDHDHCLGSYAFAWGNKQEATATWFGMLLPDGTRLGAVDALQEKWSGHKPPILCPVISSLSLEGEAQVAPGTMVNAQLNTSSPSNRPLKVEWVLQRDLEMKGLNGDAEAIPPVFPDAIIKSSTTGATVKMPRFAAAYRLFAYVRDDSGGGAVANIPLKVNVAPTFKYGEPSPMPFYLYRSDSSSLPYIPSGWMGDTGAMKIDLNDPHGRTSGAHAIRMDFTKSDGWGSIAWQSPSGDWGDKPGGFNLTGATKLTFKAKGLHGGEVASFGVGLIKNDKPYFDTAITSLKDQALTADWATYQVDLTGLDLGRIKTGLVITIAGQGQPQTIFLDEIRFEK